MSWTDVLDTDVGMLPTTRMKISRAFLGTVRHVCYHSNIFQEYGPGPHFNN